MSATLDKAAQVGHVLAFASVTPGAAWLNINAAALTQLDGGGRSITAGTRVVSVTVSNYAAAGGDTVYATFKDPGGGAATLGFPVLPQSSVDFPLYGTETPVDIWVYGAAGTPSVQVMALLAEV